LTKILLFKKILDDIGANGMKLEKSSNRFCHFKTKMSAQNKKNCPKKKHAR